MYSPAVIGIETSPPMLSSGPAWLFPTTTNRWLLLVAQSEDASGAREDGHGQAGLKNDLQHLAGHAPHDDAGEGRHLAGVEHHGVARLQLASRKVEVVRRPTLWIGDMRQVRSVQPGAPPSAQPGNCAAPGPPHATFGALLLEVPVL